MGKFEIDMRPIKRYTIKYGSDRSGLIAISINVPRTRLKITHVRAASQHLSKKLYGIAAADVSSSLRGLRRDSKAICRMLRMDPGLEQKGMATPSRAIARS